MRGCYVNADFLCATCSTKRICDKILGGGGDRIFQNQKFMDLLSQIFVDIQTNMSKKGLSQHSGRNSHNKL